MKEMKGFQWLGLAMGVLAMGVTAIAQPPEPAGPPPPDGPFPMPHVQILRDADTDKDQAISLDEFKSAHEKIFKLMDKNSDGKLDQQEQDLARDHMRDRMRTMGGPGGPGGPGEKMKQAAERGKQRFQEMDANSDGKIAKDEFKGPDERFQKLDANSDGSVTPEEFREAMGKAMRQRAGGGLEKRFDMIDANKDGKLSKDEFKGPEERFKNLDKDSNGAISREEAKAGPGRGMEPEKSE